MKLLALLLAAVVVFMPQFLPLSTKATTQYGSKARWIYKLVCHCATRGIGCPAPLWYGCFRE